MEDIKMVSYGFNTMNMLNTNSIGFGNMRMFIGGLNMFGNMVGSSIFTNCNGSFNYDAYAGFQVGSVLMNIGGAILGRVIQEKSANSNKTLTANVEDLNGRISKVERERSEYVNDKKDLEGKVTAANTEITSLNAELNKLNVSGLKAEYDRAKNEYTNAKSDDPNLATLKANMEAAEKAYKDEQKKETELKEKIKAQQDIIDTNEPKIKELNGKIKSCDEELADLKADRDAIQAQLNEQILDKADGTRLNRTSLEEFNTKDFSLEKTTATKQDMRRAIAQYRTSNDEQKLAIGEKVMQIYDKLPTEDRSNIIRQAYTIIKTEYEALKKEAEENTPAA